MQKKRCVFGLIVATRLCASDEQDDDIKHVYLEGFPQL
jgi:hypothetical protein